MLPKNLQTKEIMESGAGSLQGLDNHYDEQLNKLQQLRLLSDWAKGERGRRRRSLPSIPLVEEPESVDNKGEHGVGGGADRRRRDSRTSEA